MFSQQGFHVMGGGGENSYANNSKLQEKILLKIKPLVQDAIREIFETLPEKLVVADLGCSSGPNAIFFLSQIVNVVDECSCRTNLHKPEMQFFLNDLPNNDFNHVFQLSISYEKKIREEKNKNFLSLYICGLPGSFYGRLFPSKSVHLFHSSNSLMWLSQVPQGLVSDVGAQLNGSNIYITKESPSLVTHLYVEQFKRDFKGFLECRSKELIFGGRMILTILGRNKCSFDDSRIYIWRLLADALNAMAVEGLVDADKVNSFNMPFYAPLMEEMKSTIDMEGSFHLDQVQTNETNWDPFDESNDNFVKDKSLSGKIVAKYMRAVVEPLLVSHFGNGIMDDLFIRYSKNIAGHMIAGKPKFVFFTLLLKLKD